MEKKVIKYYKVSLSNGIRKTVSDGFEALDNGFESLMTVDTQEVEGELVEILTGKKILEADKNYNPNVFDVRTFVEGGYDLFGIKKSDLSLDELSKKIKFGYKTQEKVNKDVRNIIALEQETKAEANRQYEALLEAERNFSEEINKGRK